MNIAILIGVAEYNSDEFDNLPACINDVDAVSDLINATKMYDNIIPLKDVSAAKITDTLKEVRDNNYLKSLFIYFSGHGFAEEDEYFWAGNSFSQNIRNTTGVSQSTLFEILRSANASNVVVMQDACYSGRQIFKSAKNFTPAKGLENLLIISSSLSTEVTPAGVELSPFTDKFIEAASHAKFEGKVEYFEIYNKLKDLFNNDQRHTPHWVYQGPLGNLFCEDATNLQSIRDKYNVVEFVEEQRKLVAPLTDKEILEEADKFIISQENVQNIFDRFSDLFSEEFGSKPNLHSVFDERSKTYDNYDHIEDISTIVKELAGKSQDDNFVSARVVRKKKNRKRLKHEFAFLALYNQFYEDEPEYIEEHSLKLNASIKSVHQIFYLDPKFKLMKRPALEVVCLPGILSCEVYWRFSAQGLENWGSFSEKFSSCNWSSRVLPWDDITDFFKNYLLSSFFDKAEKSLNTAVSKAKELIVEQGD